MNKSLTIVLAGAAGGALLGAALVFGAARLGYFPASVNGLQIRDYLMAHPELVTDMTARVQEIQQAAEAKKLAAAMKKIGLAAFFDPRIAFVTGPADARKSVVEFYDYNCPYCRASLPAVKKFYDAHKNDTRFAFIEFPVDGPDSDVAAHVAMAARRQPDKYVALHFTLMAEQKPMDANLLYDDAKKVGLDMAKLKADTTDPKVDEAIAASHELARRAGIDGTPTFVINGVIHPGAVDDATLNDLTKS